MHYFGGTIHLIYVLTFTTYVNMCFLDRNFEYREQLCWGLLICLIYPLIYDGLNLIKQGPGDYFADKWNYLD